MRIESIELHSVQIPLKRAFAHAASSRSTSEAVLVRAVNEDGVEGWGEIRPRAYVTGETLEGVLEDSGPALARRLVGETFEAIEPVLAWSKAVLAEPSAPLATIGGVEAALLDVAGRRLHFSLADAIGGAPYPEVPPGVVIGFDIATPALARHCAMLRLAGRTHVKVKVGAEDDAARLRIIADVLGPELPLRLDANAVWTVDEAIERLSGLRGFALHSIEQPVAKDDLAGLARVREATGVPVMADESVCSEADAHRLVQARACDIFNVRIGKHGGLLAARRIVEIAQSAGVRIHLGTLVGETGILSRHAEVLSRSVQGAECLDGKGQHAFLLAEDILQVAETKKKAEVAGTPLHAPGLGLSVDPERVARFRVKPPHRVIERDRSMR